MKTILFLLARYPGFGGIETVTTVLANQLAQRYRVILCSLCHEHDDELLSALDKRILFYPLPHHVKQYDAENIRLFNALVQRERVEVIINQDSYFPNEYLLEHLPKAHRPRLIVAEHSAPNRVCVSVEAVKKSRPWWALYHHLKWFYLSGRVVREDRERRARLYAMSDRYVVLSEQFRRAFVENSGVAELSKFRTIPNPLSFARPPFDWQDKEKRVLFVGQFVRVKGLDRLLRIWQRVEKHVPEWHLTLVGDGPCMPEVQQYIRQQGVPRVELPGYSAHVKQFCLSAQVLCMCSSYEGFGMVLTEAMSCGAVPIAFNSFASLSDIIDDGENGYSVEAFDEDAYAARLVELLQHDVLRERMALAAWHKASAFAAGSIAQHWVDLIEELCEQ